MESEVETVLILGWSRKVPKVLAELLSYRQKRLRIDVVGITPVDEREITIESVIDAHRDETVREIETNFMDPDMLRRSILRTTMPC